MNRIHSLVWNRALRVLQVASELARSHGGGSSSAARSPALARGALAAACLFALGLGAAPLARANQDFTIAASGGDETGTQVGTSLAVGNVIINSSSGLNAGTGNIDVNDAINWTSNLLTLTAADNININSALNGTGNSSLTLNSATVNGTDTAVTGGAINLGANISTGGNQTYNGPVVLAANVTLATGNNGATIDFASTLDGGFDLSITTAGALTFGGTVGGAAQLASLNTNSSTFSAAALNIGGGGLSIITTGGAIAQTGAFTVTGNSFFDANDNAITLTNVYNAFTGPVSLDNRGVNDVALSNGSHALVLGASSVGSGSLTVSSTGISQIGAITQAAGAGTATFNAGTGAISLTNSGNDFTGAVSLNNSGPNEVTLDNGSNALHLGASTVGSGALTVSGTGITQSGAITQAAGAGAATFNAGAGALMLGNAGNDFTGAVSLDNSGANNVALNNGTNPLQLGASSVGSGSLTVSGTGITQSGAITQAAGAGAATFDAGAGALTLVNSGNDFTGAVSLNNTGTNDVMLDNGSNALLLGASNVGSGSLTVSGAGIAQSGALVVAGASSFNAGAGALMLSNAGNDFTGAVTAIGTGVAITDANDLTIGGIADSGNGNVSLIAGGTLALPGSGIDAGSGNIFLASNGGSLATAGNLSGANVSLSGANGLMLDSNVTASGTLDLSQAGNIAQIAGVISAGTLTGSSSGPAVLTAAGNLVDDLGNFSAGGGFSLNDGGPLTVSGTVDGGPGGTAIITTGNLTINGAVGSGTGNISLGTNGSLDIKGSVNGGNVNLSATGNTLLTGTLGSTGGTTLSAGNLQIGNGSQAGTLTGDLNLAGSTNGVIFDEPGATTYGGVISGVGTLTQQGPGTLILNGASTATGLTTVATGSTLLVGDSSHATATVGGDVSVNGGTLGGFGTIKGSATLANSATLAPGAVQGDGTLSIDGDLTIGDGSQLDFDFGAPGPNFGTPGQSDHVTVNGNLSIGTSTLNVNNVGGMGPGLYNLFNWGGSLAITGGGFAPPNGMSLQILTVDKQINLVDTQGLTLNEWDANGLAGPGAMGGGSGTWSTSSNTWSDTTGQYVGPMAPQPGFAIFGGAPGTVTVDDTNGQVSVTGMQFAVNGYTLLGGPLTLVASNGVAPIIRVGDGSSAGAGMTATIDSELTGSDGFTKTDAGTLILGGQGTSNTLTGGIAVQGGTLLLGNDAGGGLSSFDDAVTMSSGTRLIVDSATLQPGKYGSVTTGRTAVSGSGFSVGVGYTGAGNIYGGVGGKYQSGFAGGAGIDGSDFVVTNASGGQIGGGAGGISTSRNKTDTGGNGGIGISGSGFTLTNAGYVSGGVGGPGPVGGAGGAAMYGSAFTATNQGGGKIVGGPGGSGKYTAGMGGAAVGGSGFTLVNENGASIRGGQGGKGMNAGAIGGAGGAAVAGTGFTLVNSGNIYGGQGGYYNTQGNGTAGLGGVGVVGLGGANVTTSGLIAGGLDGSLYSSKTPGTQRADAVEFSGGGNTLTLESGFSFQGNVVSTSGTTNGGDTLALGGTASGAFDVSNIVDGLPANATATQYAGFNAFEKTGTGTWTLTGSGTNAASENWTIANGTLQGDATTFAHSATLTFAPGAGDTAALVFDQGSSNANSPATAAFGGAISGNGGVTKIDDGTLILTGANTFTGGTTVSAGTLQIGNGGTAGSIVGDVADAGALVFDRADAVTFAGAISGNGSLVQEGAGTLILNGDSGAFTGATRISDGALVVGDDAHANAALGGTVTVAKGATLAGIGTIGGMDLSGTLSPGGSIGTLHVSGNATFEQGSMFNVEASPDGTSDQLAVGGTVTIKGGSVVAIAQAGNWAPQTTYTIISAGQGVSGTFGGVSDNLAFLTPVLAYSANAVSLSLQRNDINFADVALTPNQKGAATGEQGLGFGNALYDALVKLDAPTARNAFDQTSGEYHASQQTARINDSRYVREAMDQRLRAGDADPEAAKQGDTNLSAWAHAWGHWGTTDSDGNAGRLADNGDGLLVGADLPVGTQARIGVTGGASRNSLSVGSRASWGRLTSQWLGAFGGFEQGAFALRGGIAYGWDQVPSNREIAFPGYSDRLSGNAAGDTLTGFVESAWTFKLAQGSIAPFVNLAHTRVETDASNEAGGAAALHASEGSANVSFSTVGARGSVQFARGLDVHGELGWQHAFGDTTPERTLQFVAGGPAFTEYGVPIAKNAGLGKAGIGWHAGRVAIDADYEGLFGGGAKDQAAKLSVSVAF